MTPDAGTDTHADPAEAAAAVLAATDPRALYRSAHARPRSLGWRAWVDRVADALRDTHKAPDLASSLRQCGRLAWVSACGACGDLEARVEIRASCDVRVCPWCARRRSAARAEAVGEACELAVALVHARRDAARAGVLAAEAEALEALESHRETARRAKDRRSKRVAYWSAVAAGARRRKDDDKHARAQRYIAAAIDEEGAVERRAQALAAKAAHRVRVCRRELHAIRESSAVRLDGGRRRGAWGWRLVTISPRWNPRDPAEVTPEGLRRRIDDVLRRWSRCWREGVRAGGLAAAYASVEVSAGGHVHAHVLYLGPWVAAQWWRSVAGCFVDVRACVDVPGAALGRPPREALREAVKYALKSPSPHSVRWVSGDAREVAHPGLAAAWVIATRHHQIARAYGVLRDALDVHDASDDGDEITDSAEDSASVRECRCATCGAELTAVARPVETAALARRLGARWTLRASRAGDDNTLGPLPPRVTMPRFASG